MAINRRSFLIGSGCAMLIQCPGLLGAGPPAPARPLGLQLYTVRQVFSSDPVGTLERIAEIGYREIEFSGGGYYEMDHAMLRRTMDRVKLKAPSIHAGYSLLLDRMDAVIAMARTLGADTVVLPYLAPEQRADVAFDALLPNLNRFATRLQSAGLGFAYHNHEFEFAPRASGSTMFERLLDQTDPQLVKLELDLYWATFARQNVPKLIRRLASRLYSFHLKDMAADRSMTAVGTGTIDFAAILGMPAAAGVRHLYVENDDAPAPYFPDVATSFRNLRSLRL